MASEATKDQAAVFRDCVNYKPGRSRKMFSVAACLERVVNVHDKKHATRAMDSLAYLSSCADLAAFARGGGRAVDVAEKAILFSIYYDGNNRDPDSDWIQNLDENIVANATLAELRQLRAR